MNQNRYATGSAGYGGGFSAYAAGNKQYGGGRSNPTSGPVDPLGYVNRDAAIRARRDAILRRLSSSQTGQYINPSSVR